MVTSPVQTNERWYHHFDYFVIDLVFTMAVYFAACVIRLYQINAEFAPIYWDMAIALIPMIILVEIGTRPHRDIERRPAYRELTATMEYVSGVTILLLLFQYLTQVGGDFSRGAFIYFWLFGTFAVFAVRMIYKRIRNRVQLASVRKVILVIDGEEPDAKIRYFRKQGERQYRIAAVACLNRKAEQNLSVLLSSEKAEYREGDIEEKVEIISDISGLYEYAEAHTECEVLLSISDAETEKQIIREMLMMGITSHVNLNREYDGLPNMHVETLADQLVITSSIQPFSPFQRAVKRLGDIVGSLIGLVITFLVVLVVGPIIKIQSRGPIFFSQIRIGKSGRKFKMYKLRSMYVDAEERKAALMDQNEMNGPIFKIADDPRITPIGRFIRKFSIDELPQFWNVLKGDMSLVGTRPPTVDEWERYTAHHKARLAIKPGITGLWQVSGRNEITDFEEVVALDLKYIQEWSLLEDMRIILRTIGVVFGAVGAK